jgi:hypothetical protein
MGEARLLKSKEQRDEGRERPSSVLFSPSLLQQSCWVKRTIKPARGQEIR